MQGSKGIQLVFVNDQEPLLSTHQTLYESEKNRVEILFLGYSSFMFKFGAIA